MPGFRSEVMVGRGRELDALRGVAARVRDGGAAATVLVLGVAGVGKTRLAGDLAKELEAQGWLCATSHGIELAGGELPFGATIELLRTVVRSIDAAEVFSILGPQADALAPLLPTLSSTQRHHWDRASVIGAVVDLLDRVNRPVCWWLEDLPWMDAPTRDLVAYLAKVLDRVPVLLLATVRTDPMQSAEVPVELVEIGRTAVVIPVAPLNYAQTTGLVCELEGTKCLNRRDVDRICESSDGIPFFVEQLVANGGKATGSLRSVVLTGVRALSPDARTLLQTAAVGEGLLLPAYLRSVTGLGAAFDPALAEARETGMLRAAGGRDVLEFRHALLREIIDADLLADERLRLHEAWAREIEVALESNGNDPRLVMERARHRYAVGGSNALESTIEAARVAGRGDDARLRMRWWERTLELWPPDEDPVAGMKRDIALGEYIYSLWAMGQADRIVPLVDSEVADEHDWLRTLWLERQQRTAQRVMLETFEPVLPPDQAQATAERLMALSADFRARDLLLNLAGDWMAQQPDLARTMFEEAAAAMDEDLDPVMAMHAWRLLGTLDLARGDPQGQLARAEKTWEWACRTGVRDRNRARGFLANGLNDMGRTRAALELVETNIRETRDRYLSPNAWVNQQIGVARLGLELGEWDRVAVAVDDMMTDIWAGDIGAVQRSTAATFLARRGDLVGARQLRDEIPEAPPDAPPGLEASAETGWRALASLEIAMVEDDLSGVRAVCRLYDELSLPGDVPLDVWMTHAQGLRIVTRDGSNGARTFAADALAAVASRPSGGPIPQACRTEIDAHADRVGNRDSVDQWAGAAAHWTAMERVYDEGWCHLFEAECALRDGDRERGERLLRETWELCCRLREVPLRRKVESAARAAGLDGMGDPEPPPPTRATLTHREHEVLTLIADGRTNAEIAATLVISQKTASVHVSHIIAKLGVGNRTGAAAYAHRQGLAAPRA